MAIKSAVFFAATVLGCLALPTPDTDFAQFFEYVDSDPHGRIVGGTIAPVGAHPHMVALTTGTWTRNLLCGGSLLTQRTILTAAHCIDAVFIFGSLHGNLRATVGSIGWLIGTSYSISNNVTHPHYVASTIKNDLGILYTRHVVHLSDLIKPIALDYEYAGANIECRVAGWGRIRTSGPVSYELLELDVLTLAGEQCVSSMATVTSAAVEPHIELCTMHPRGSGHGMCHGDSGSALVRRDHGTQIGIVSWGIPCARGAPDVFVRVSAYRAWFERHIW